MITISFTLEEVRAALIEADQDLTDEQAEALQEIYRKFATALVEHMS